jgi:hypothetical protein
VSLYGAPKDPGRSGATQPWFGMGSSLYDIVPQQSVKAGNFTTAGTDCWPA